MKRVLIAVLLLGVLGAAGVFGYKLYRDRAVDAYAHQSFGSEEKKLVTVPAGSGPQSVAKLLAQAQVVSDEKLLYAYLRQHALGPKLRAGEYEFKGANTPAYVIEQLVAGKTKTYRFTVPEGLRVEEILPILASSELKLDLGKLTALAEDKAWLRKQGIPASPSGIDGYLFPDTYTFTRPFSEQSVLAKMVSRATEELKQAETQRKPGVKLDAAQAMVLASIIEKETGRAEERPRISCVFHNRLRLGIPLATDPTVLYASKLMRGSFVKNITKQDLSTPHPYNTYVVKGLPPGPIASPGTEAIVAALHPLECSDLFFVSRNDGTHVFCPNLKCHEAAVEEWQRRYFQKKKQKGS